MTPSTRPAAPAPSFWAGPVIIVGPGSADGTAAEAIPVLVLWHQAPDGASNPPTAQTGMPGPDELLERGFARLPAPDVAAVHALPRLDGAQVRLSADGARFQLLDGPDLLVTGELSAVSAQWRDPVRAAGLLAVLVATEQQPEPGSDEDSDPAARAMHRMVAACTAGAMVGAHLTVRITEPEPV